MTRTIPTAVLGATGYVGGELLRLITAHPALALRAAVSTSQAGTSIGALFPALAAACGETAFCSPEDCLELLADVDELALFSAAPHGASAALVARIAGAAAAQNVTLHAVDVSADFRYPSPSDYAAVYGQEHGAPALLPEFQQGLPEHVAATDKQHVGHPGCFATAALLAAVPLARARPSLTNVFVSGITGSTGSGRSPLPGTHHPERHSNLYAYKPLAHRHAPEIERQIAAAGGGSVTVDFVPHSGPFARGIHVTLQARLAEPLTGDELRELYRAAYPDPGFVRVVAGAPRLKDVVASNYAHVGVAARGDTVVVLCALDNLVKGAAGGAVQWMNRLWSLPEQSGLTAVSPAWT